jgi:hypothetical protein
VEKDFATLSNGTQSSGSMVEGATSGTLKVSRLSGADVGRYWLVAKNGFGEVITRPVDVVISTPPVITQQPYAPAGLTVGDPLTLTATVSGGVPIYFQWVKDGVASRWSVTDSSTISLTIPKTTAASAGKYTLVVLNQFDKVSSETVDVSFAAPAVSANSTRKPSR